MGVQSKLFKWELSLEGEHTIIGHAISSVVGRKIEPRIARRQAGHQRKGLAKTGIHSMYLYFRLSMSGRRIVKTK